MIDCRGRRSVTEFEPFTRLGADQHRKVIEGHNSLYSIMRVERLKVLANGDLVLRICLNGMIDLKNILKREIVRYHGRTEAFRARKIHGAGVTEQYERALRLAEPIIRDG